MVGRTGRTPNRSAGPPERAAIVLRTGHENIRVGRMQFAFEELRDCQCRVMVLPSVAGVRGADHAAIVAANQACTTPEKNPMIGMNGRADVRPFWRSAAVIAPPEILSPGDHG